MCSQGCLMKIELSSTSRLFKTMPQSHPFFKSKYCLPLPGFERVGARLSTSGSDRATSLWVQNLTAILQALSILSDIDHQALFSISWMGSMYQARARYPDCWRPKQGELRVYLHLQHQTHICTRNNTVLTLPFFVQFWTCGC